MHLFSSLLSPHTKLAEPRPNGCTPLALIIHIQVVLFDARLSTNSSPIITLIRVREPDTHRQSLAFPFAPRTFELVLGW